MTYPISEDKKIRKLSRMLTKYAEEQGIEFSFAGDVVYPQEAFAHFGCLSLFLVEAKEHYEKLYNNLYTVEELMEPLSVSIRDLTEDEKLIEKQYLDSLPREKLFPIEFHEQEDETYFGFIPRPTDGSAIDFAIIAHLSHYTVEEYCRIYQKQKMLLLEGRIPLDPLYDKMLRKLNFHELEPIPQSRLRTSNELDVDSSFGQDNS